MKTNPNDLVYPVSESDSHVGGLTKREYFAAMRRPQEGDNSLSKAAAEAIMGEAAPTKFDLDSIKWWVAAEEKLAVLHADALINALNETK